MSPTLHLLNVVLMMLATKSVSRPLIIPLTRKRRKALLSGSGCSISLRLVLCVLLCALSSRRLRALSSSPLVPLYFRFACALLCVVFARPQLRFLFSLLFFCLSSSSPRLLAPLRLCFAVVVLCSRLLYHRFLYIYIFIFIYPSLRCGTVPAAGLCSPSSLTASGCPPLC